MSNSKRAKWTEAEVTAANALDLLGGWWEAAEAEAVRRVLTRNLLADLAADGHEPGMIARVEQRLLDGLDEDDWLEIGRSSGMLPAGGGV